MRAISYLIVAVGLLLPTNAWADIITVTYTGTIDYLNYYPFRYAGGPDYDGLLGPFVLKTFIDTSSGVSTPIPGGYSFTAGFAPLPDPACCGYYVPEIPDFAILTGPSMSVEWGYYGATATVIGSSVVAQSFTSIAGGPGYFDVILPYVDLGTDAFFIDPGYPSGISISGSLTIESETVTSIPEPSTWVMLLIGFVSLSLVRTFSLSRRST